MARSRTARISQDLDSLVSIDAEEDILVGWGQNSDASVHSKKDKNKICNSIRINNSRSVPTTQKFVESHNNVTNTGTVPVTGHIGFVSHMQFPITKQFKQCTCYMQIKVLLILPRHLAHDQDLPINLEMIEDRVFLYEVGALRYEDSAVL